MVVYAHAYTCMQTCAYIYIYTHVVHGCRYMYATIVCIGTNVHVYGRMYVRMRARMCVSICVWLRTCMQARTSLPPTIHPSICAYVIICVLPRSVIGVYTSEHRYAYTNICWANGQTLRAQLEHHLGRRSMIIVAGYVSVDISIIVVDILDHYYYYYYYVSVDISFCVCTHPCVEGAPPKVLRAGGHPWKLTKNQPRSTKKPSTRQEHFRGAMHPEGM